MVPNSPPTNTDEPSGPGASASTTSLSCGRKLGSMTPVSMSNAKRELRVRSWDVPARRTVVKVPPTTTLVPIWTMALTWPSWICGVQSAGSGLTSFEWVVSEASDGVGTPRSSAAPSTSATANGRERAGRRLMFRWSPDVQSGRSGLSRSLKISGTRSTAHRRKQQDNYVVCPSRLPRNGTNGSPRRSGHRHQRDAGVGLPTDVGGVAADPQALGGHVQVLAAHAAVLGRVPRQRQAGGRADRADAGSADRARPRAVAALRVVEPALVALE